MLALDTTSPPGSAAVFTPGGQLLVSSPADPRPFGARLPTWLFDVLGEAGSTIHDIDRLVVGAGPGSLTGLRVGIATMQGLALSAGRPLVAVSALEALAHLALEGESPAGAGTLVVAWQDARRGEVFAQWFAVGEGRRLTPCSDAVVGVPGELAPRIVAAGGGAALAVVGDAAVSSEALWRAAGVTRLALLPAAPLAGVMARLGAAAPEAGPPHAVRPLYVRRPDAVVARERTGHAGPRP